MSNKAKQAASLNIVRKAQRDNWLNLDSETAFAKIRQQWYNRGYRGEKLLESLTLNTMERLIPEGE